MKTLRNVRWVFLDVGGVLVNEDGATEGRLRSLRTALRKRGIRKTITEVRRVYRKAWTTGVARPFVGAASELAGDAGIGHALWKSIPYPYARDRLVKGAPGIVRTLKQSGYRVGILANQPSSCRGRLRRWGILKHVQVSVISGVVKMEKPDPRIFRLALRKSRCRPADAVMIGDRIDNDIRPARRIGMRTIRLRTGWGRPQIARSRADRPDVTVPQLRGILKVLGCGSGSVR